MTNRRRLKLLANYLLNLPKNYKHFDMSRYFYAPDNYLFQPINAKYELIRKDISCETSACALGHAPSISDTFSPINNEDWEEYCSRIFSIRPHNTLWSWLFNADWDNFDNTPTGAALRIYYYLDFDFPDEYRNVVSSMSDHKTTIRKFVKLYCDAYDIVDI